MTTRTLPRPAPGGAERAPGGAERWFGVKTQIHARLLGSLTPDQLRTLTKEGVRDQIATVAEKIVGESATPMTVGERDRLVEEVLDEVFGLGPLEPLMKDPTISDILVNNFDSVYVERAGQLVETNVRFKDQAHVRIIIDRIVSNIGRRIDDSSPIVDARLPDGSRVCAVIPPLSLTGPVISIRRFGKKLLSTDDLVKNETFTAAMLDFLRGCVEARLNVVVSGGSGSGKTTMLNTLSRFIPETERIVTIEDTAELAMQQEHIVRLETRQTNIEGAGSITQRDLVINALRMRPDRIIVGECRGSEALDMLQAMNTGHDGSMTTTHANTAVDCFSRLETMVMMASQHIPDKVIRHMLASAVNVVVQTARLPDGTRKVVSISEVTGVEGDTIALQEVFGFDREGVSARGKAVGQFTGRGVRSVNMDRLRAYGVKLPDSIFSDVYPVKDR
ncbi:MAG: CpaF family protein [Bryobacteraceae bacterium]|nr:CpaF family protein [Bryobacteraceae bacterium]